MSEDLIYELVKLSAAISLLGAFIDLVFILPVFKTKAHKLGLWFLVVTQGIFATSILNGAIWAPLDTILIMQILSICGWFTITLGYAKLTIKFWIREFNNDATCNKKTSH